jgi:hypothetical protein
MKILKQGKKQPDLLFSCSRCGCEFECERSEISESYYTIVRSIYVHGCPCCGAACYHYDDSDRYEPLHIGKER